MSTPPAGQHLASILTSKGSPLSLIHRPTATPGPNELLIEVKALALNPADNAQLHLGILIASYPYILGSDIAGTIVSVHPSVTEYKTGDRVLAGVSAYFENANNDYGAFQKFVLAKKWAVTPLPDGVSFSQGAMLPMAVSTAWNGWFGLEIPRDTKWQPEDKKGMLVWGGASSVGSAALQSAKLMGYVIYTTASSKHHEYLKSLGATHVFDYHDEDVVRKIVEVAKGEGVSLDIGYDAVGQMHSCMGVLKEFKVNGKAKMAEVIPSMEDRDKDGVAVRNMKMPRDSPEAFQEHFHFIFNVWLKDKLESGEYVPSPGLQVVEGGLESLPKHLDTLKAGVSGVKLVLEI
ncbi:related to toxD protein [Phialocephala subalpina]|uniref:Related to toxD protein n=1 Tax=Phialocephala subalpina TaxID=576137 RepID=A0A1L7WQF1_9HELO|nr:related to toxD protein [Phialocephala subalpina]